MHGGARTFASGGSAKGQSTNNRGTALDMTDRLAFDASTLAFGFCKRQCCVPAKRVDGVKEGLHDVSHAVSMLVNGTISFSAETICSACCVHAKFSAKAHAQCCGYAIVKGFSGGPGRVPN